MSKPTQFWMKTNGEKLTVSAQKKTPQCHNVMPLASRDCFWDFSCLIYLHYCMKLTFLNAIKHSFFMAGAPRLDTVLAFTSICRCTWDFTTGWLCTVTCNPCIPFQLLQNMTWDLHYSGGYRPKISPEGRHLLFPLIFQKNACDF